VLAVSRVLYDMRELENDMELADSNVTALTSVMADSF